MEYQKIKQSQKFTWQKCIFQKSVNFMEKLIALFKFN